MKQIKHFVLTTLAASLVSISAFAHGETTPDSPVYFSKNGGIIYKKTSLGDRIPDFSYCGYMASEVGIPDIAVQVRVPWAEGDATRRIQQAIDYVSSLPAGVDGFRGAVMIENGRFLLNGSLSVKTSGVVLRGSGYGENGTVLVGAGGDRATLIRIAGVDNKKSENPVKIAKQYIPVNSTVLPLESTKEFKVGDRVTITRPSTKEWLAELGTDKIGLHVDYQLTFWGEGDFDINWDRTITAVSPTSITVDVPITNSLDPQYGGGTVTKYEWTGRINNVGVENLRCESEYDSKNPKDENHRWMAITVDNAENGWVRRVVAQNFASSAVAVWESARCFTVEDCKSLTPVSETGGYRRYSFQTTGQQILFQRCYAEYGYHDFSVGFNTAGPNAFVQCYSFMPHNFSGAVGGWSNGTLFDKITVDGGNLSVAYRDVDAQGGGWSGANSMFWQCRAAQLHLPAPPTAQNWAFGSWSQGYGNGHHEIPHSFLKPESFYYAQLEARTDKKSDETDKILIYESQETTAPTPEYAAKMSLRSKSPDLIMDKWIDMMVEQYPILTTLNIVPSIDEINPPKINMLKINKPYFLVKNGVVVRGNEAVAGKMNRTSMWRGSTRASNMKQPSPNLVRFVPGRVGRGLTDDLDTLVSDMIDNGSFAMQSFPALWYERRRDDHARTRRANADVWAPFYEQPFSRSGEGEAFDRLSKYDLTKYNIWYWLRLKQFADLADQNGLLFIQDHYLQHNIIEEGAHWADYPWRSANNINNLGFAENPPYAGDKRIYMGDEFYDISNPVRAKFHKEYIRKSLNEFKDNKNIIHHLGIEYTGPMHFAKFWLDVIGEWETENGVNVMVMLPGTKDVQDGVLNDPEYSKLIDIIDVRQWQYREDGTLYAPQGGVSLTDRQYARIIDQGKGTFNGVYRAVSEYRNAYPDKAIVYSRGGASGWASFVAGGSFTNIPNIADRKFYSDAAKMSPLKNVTENGKHWGMGEQKVGYIVYCDTTEVKLNLINDPTTYIARWIDPKTGTQLGVDKKVKCGGEIIIKTPDSTPVILWLFKK